jgi:MFS family permease
VTARLGYVRTAAVAAGLVAVAVAALGIAPWAAMVVIAMALNGLFSGVVLPATASMIGLETPSEAQSTVFGLNASSVALGFAFGPIIGGTVAAASGVQASLFVVAGLGVLLAVLIARGAREPAR